MKGKETIHKHPGSRRIEPPRNRFQNNLYGGSHVSTKNKPTINFTITFPGRTEFRGRAKRTTDFSSPPECFPLSSITIAGPAWFFRRQSVHSAQADAAGNESSIWAT